MARFDLLHISDLHVSTCPYAVSVVDAWKPILNWWRRLGHAPMPHPAVMSSHDSDVMLAAAAFAFNALRENPNEFDAILLTGDLATAGDQACLDAAKRFLDDPSSGIDHRTPDGRATFRAAGKPIIVLPGNHDRYGPSPTYNPGSPLFDGTFNTQIGLRCAWTAGQGAQELWRETHDGVTLAVIGADFTLPGGDPGQHCPYGVWQVPGRLGQGRATHGGKDDSGRNVLRDLEGLTRNARSSPDPCVVVWAVHFDPMNSVDCSLQLLDSRHFLDACDQLNIPLVLCGHTHMSRRDASRNTRVEVCGTTTQFHTSHGMNELHLVTIDWTGNADDRPQIAVDRYSYQTGGRQFQYDP
jgi:hypothetical protein